MRKRIPALTAMVFAAALLLSAGAALAHDDGYLYYGPHPVPYSVSGDFDSDWVDWEDYHYFPYAPDPEEMDLYIIEEGAYIFVGDPTMYADAHGEEYWYYDPHPVDYWGHHHVCHIAGPHVHYFAPTVIWLDHYYWDGHTYVWYGPWYGGHPPHKKIYLSHRYPHTYGHRHKHAKMHKHYKSHPPAKKHPGGHHGGKAPGKHAKKPRYEGPGAHKGPGKGFKGKQFGDGDSKGPKKAMHGDRGKRGKKDNRGNAYGNRGKRGTKDNRGSAYGNRGKRGSSKSEARKSNGKRSSSKGRSVGKGRSAPRPKGHTGSRGSSRGNSGSRKGSSKGRNGHR